MNSSLLHSLSQFKVSKPVSAGSFSKLFNLNFYTSWSNIMFYTVLVWSVIGIYLQKIAPPSWIKGGAIANMVAVGIIGTLLCGARMGQIVKLLKAYNPDPDYVENAVTGISMGNIIVHFLPMIIAFIWLLIAGRKMKGIKWQFSVYFLLVFGFVWMCVPHTGDKKVFCGKVNEDYDNPPLWMIALLPITWAAILLYLTKSS